jgi:hypothetical protein
LLGKGRTDPRLSIAKSAYEAAKGRTPSPIVTEWDEFKHPRLRADPRRACPDPRSSSMVATSSTSPKLREIGFRAFGIGK